MPVTTGSSHPGGQQHPASYGIERGRPQSVLPEAASFVTSQPPNHFSVISTISPGSLAAAYQALHAGPAAKTQGERAILSGLGVPGALSAYKEVLESD